jgi:hypothetical protein
MQIHPMERRARRAAAAYIAEFAAWSWWIGLTFRCEVSEETARKALRAWLRILARDAVGEHFRFAYAMGRQSDGRWHFHVLLKIPLLHSASLSPEWAIHAWEIVPFPTGRDDARVFDPSMGAEIYMAMGHVETEWNIACPRNEDCAHRRCAVASAGWR